MYTKILDDAVQRAQGDGIQLHVFSDAVKRWLTCPKPQVEFDSFGAAYHPMDMCPTMWNG
jgi:hypothetical protein